MSPQHNDEDLDTTNNQQKTTRFQRFAAVPLDQLFKKFRAGVIYFFVGGMMIYMANVSLEPSIKQELVMLGGLLLGGLGFILAITAQFRMVLARIYFFFNKQDD